MWLYVMPASSALSVTRNHDPTPYLTLTLRLGADWRDCSITDRKNASTSSLKPSTASVSSFWLSVAMLPPANSVRVSVSFPQLFVVPAGPFVFGRARDDLRP